MLCLIDSRGKLHAHTRGRLNFPKYCSESTKTASDTADSGGWAQLWLDETRVNCSHWIRKNLIKHTTRAHDDDSATLFCHRLNLWIVVFSLGFALRSLACATSFFYSREDLTRERATQHKRESATHQITQFLCFCDRFFNFSSIRERPSVSQSAPIYRQPARPHLPYRRLHLSSGFDVKLLRKAGATSKTTTTKTSSVECEKLRAGIQVGSNSQQQQHGLVAQHHRTEDSLDSGEEAARSERSLLGDQEGEQERRRQRRK